MSAAAFATRAYRQVENQGIPADKLYVLGLDGILEYLLLNQGRPVSQEELIEHVWDSSVNSFSNATRVHISSLRKKLRGAVGTADVRDE